MKFLLDCKRKPVDFVTGLTKAEILSVLPDSRLPGLLQDGVTLGELRKEVLSIGRAIESLSRSKSERLLRELEIQNTELSRWSRKWSKSLPPEAQAALQQIKADGNGHGKRTTSID